MANRRAPLNLSINLSLDHPGSTSEAAPTRRALPPLPDGFKEIEARFLRRGESKPYAKEHAARVWNDAHPESTVETSFDGEKGGFVPGNSNLAKVKRKDPAPDAPDVPDVPKVKRKAPKDTKDAA